jgi:hypothetical protein
VKFQFNKSETLEITVGKGGSGGTGKSSSKMGNSGGDGGKTSIQIGSTVFAAEGGIGGGKTSLNGGSGGTTIFKPADFDNLLDWEAKAGTNGSTGTEKDNLLNRQGGDAAKIEEIGSEISFGGGLGARNGATAQEGGGGRSGYGSSQSGEAGGNGKVLITVTYFEEL